MSEEGQFDATKAARISGMSRYMVDYLARAGIVIPSIHAAPGRGRRRQYSFGDLVALRTTAALLQSGISVARLKVGLAELQRKYGRKLNNTPADYLWTNGIDVYFRSKDAVISNLSRGGQLAFGFMIDLRRIHRETDKLVRRLAA